MARWQPFVTRWRNWGVARALDALGHRVVHGGRRPVEGVVIVGATERTIDELSTLAPLHNPVALAGIRTLRELIADLPMAALFDTAFHASRADTSS